MARPISEDRVAPTGRPGDPALQSVIYDRQAGGNCMSLHDRIEALREKHALLERAIDEEIHRPLPNQETVHDLKRQKLRIKDEIFQLERQ
jgi:hypothetical protein